MKVSRGENIIVAREEISEISDSQSLRAKSNQHKLACTRKMGTQDNNKKRRNGSNAASNAIAMRKVMFIVVFIFICIFMPMMNHMNIDDSFLISYADQISSPFYFAADKGDNRENGMDTDDAHKNDNGRDVTEDIQRDINNDGTEKFVIFHDNKNDTGNESIGDGDGGKERSTVIINNTANADTDTDTDTNDKANIKTIINDEKEDANGDKEEKVAAEIKSNGEDKEKDGKADKKDNKKKEEDENEGEGDKTQDQEEAKKGPEYEPLAPHPHAGARYPDGRYGYVPDLTAVRIMNVVLG